MRPRVPSIGSTRTTISTSSGRVPSRQHAPAVLPEPLGDEEHRPVPGQHLELRQQHLLRHPIDGEQRVTGVVAHHRRQLVAGAGLAAGDDAVADRFVDAANPGQQRSASATSRTSGHGQLDDAWWTPGTARSSAAFSSGEVSARKLPPPISGPARYLSRLGRRSGG